MRRRCQSQLVSAVHGSLKSPPATATRAIVILLAYMVLVGATLAHSTQQRSSAPNASVNARARDPKEPAPEPYSFSYSAQSYGGLSSHQEQGDASGRITGFYTIMGDDGRQRRVDYVADDDGYRATVNTNEIGTRAENSADVEYLVEPPSAKQLESAGVTLEFYNQMEDIHRETKDRLLATLMANAAGAPSLAAPTNQLGPDRQLQTRQSGQPESQGSWRATSNSMGRTTDFGRLSKPAVFGRQEATGDASNNRFNYGTLNGASTMDDLQQYVQQKEQPFPNNNDNQLGAQVDQQQQQQQEQQQAGGQQATGDDDRRRTSTMQPATTPASSSFAVIELNNDSDDNNRQQQQPMRQQPGQTSEDLPTINQQAVGARQQDDTSSVQQFQQSNRPQQQNGQSSQSFVQQQQQQQRRPSGSSFGSNQQREQDLDVTNNDQIGEGAGQQLQRKQNTNDVNEQQLPQFLSINQQRQQQQQVTGGVIGQGESKTLQASRQQPMVTTTVRPLAISSSLAMDTNKQETSRQQTDNNDNKNNNLDDNNMSGLQQQQQVSGIQQQAAGQGNNDLEATQQEKGQFPTANDDATSANVVNGGTQTDLQMIDDQNPTIKETGTMDQTVADFNDRPTGQLISTTANPTNDNNANNNNNNNNNNNDNTDNTDRTDNNNNVVNVVNQNNQQAQQVAPVEPQQPVTTFSPTQQVVTRVPLVQRPRQPSSTTQMTILQQQLQQQFLQQVEQLKEEDYPRRDQPQPALEGGDSDKPVELTLQTNSPVVDTNLEDTGNKFNVNNNNQQQQVELSSGRPVVAITTNTTMAPTTTAGTAPTTQVDAITTTTTTSRPIISGSISASGPEKRRQQQQKQQQQQQRVNSNGFFGQLTNKQSMGQTSGGIGQEGTKTTGSFGSVINQQQPARITNKPTISSSIIMRASMKADRPSTTQATNNFKQQGLQQRPQSNLIGGGVDANNNNNNNNNNENVDVNGKTTTITTTTINSIVDGGSLTPTNNPLLPTTTTTASPAPLTENNFQQMRNTDTRPLVSNGKSGGIVAVQQGNGAKSSGGAIKGGGSRFSPSQPKQKTTFKMASQRVQQQQQQQQTVENGQRQPRIQLARQQPQQLNQGLVQQQFRLITTTANPLFAMPETTPTLQQMTNAKSMANLQNVFRPTTTTSRPTVGTFEAPTTTGAPIFVKSTTISQGQAPQSVFQNVFSRLQPRPALQQQQQKQQPVDGKTNGKKKQSPLMQSSMRVNQPSAQFITTPMVVDTTPSSQFGSFQQLVANNNGNMGKSPSRTTPTAAPATTTTASAPTTVKFSANKDEDEADADVVGQQDQTSQTTTTKSSTMPSTTQSILFIDTSSQEFAPSTSAPKTSPVTTTTFSTPSVTELVTNFQPDFDSKMQSWTTDNRRQQGPVSNPISQTNMARQQKWKQQNQALSANQITNNNNNINNNVQQQIRTGTKGSGGSKRITFGFSRRPENTISTSTSATFASNSIGPWSSRPMQQQQFTIVEAPTTRSPLLTVSSGRKSTNNSISMNQQKTNVDDAPVGFGSRLNANAGSRKI